MPHLERCSTHLEIAMLSKHDELLLKDLKLQPTWLLWFYVAIGIAAAGFGLVSSGASLESILCIGGGFLVALGAEKLVTRRIRNAAASLVLSAAAPRHPLTPTPAPSAAGESVSADVADREK